MTDAISEIKKHIKNNTAVIGTERTIKGLKTGKITHIYFSSNCPEKVRKDLEKYCKMVNCQMEDLSIPNDELGVLCKKPFSISVLGLVA